MSLSKSMVSVVTCVLFFSVLSGCYDGESNSYQEAVQASELGLDAIALKSDNTVISEEQTLQLTAIGQIQDGTESDMNSRVRWTSSDDAIINVDEAGLVTAVSPGSVIVSVEYAGFHDELDITVSSADLVAISVQTDNTSIDVCTAAQFTATGEFSDGSLRDISDSVTWQTSDSARGRFSTTGELTTYTSGPLEVSAAMEDIQSTNLTVSVLESLVSIAVAPADAEIDSASTQQYSATGEDTEGTSDITSIVTWDTTNTDGTDSAYLSFTDNSVSPGLATAIDLGTVFVSASCNNITGSTTATVVEVQEVTLDGITISDGEATVVVNVDDEELQLSLTAFFSDGTSQDVTEDADWFVDQTISGTAVSISNETDNKGLVTLSGIGETLIEVFYEGKTALVKIEVEE